MSYGEYTDFLRKDARNLTKQAKAGELGQVRFREEFVDQVLGQLKAGRSVLLVGPSGIGKTSIIYALAERLAQRKKNRLYELSTSLFMSGTRWLGDWQSKAASLLADAQAKSTYLYFSDIWNMPQTGATTNDPATLFDAVRPYLGRAAIRMIGEVTHEQLNTLQRRHDIGALFQILEVPELEHQQVRDVIAGEAKRIQIDLDDDALTALVRLPSRFSPTRPPPGNALRLLAQVKDYQEEKSRVNETAEATAEFVEKVFSIYSGLPLFIVSSAETRQAAEIRAWFHERLIGQREAIDKVVESIALFKAGLNDPERPLGSFLFVGPTGVGKTELARALSTFLFGSVHRMLRFDLSEYSDGNSIARLVGSIHDPSTPALLVDPVRTNPFQVILLDELEKAHPSVWDLLLPLLDEGRLTPPDGKTVDFRNTIIICTSNVGATEASKPSLGFADGTAGASNEAKVRATLQSEFRPEFLNRFNHICVFHPLEPNDLRTIARLELRRILVRDGITSRNLLVDVSDTALDWVIRHGFNPRYGARALKREIQSRVVMPLAMTLMERAPEPGSMLSVYLKDDRLRVRVTDTPDSKERRQANEPIQLAERRSLSKSDLISLLGDLGVRLTDLAEDLDTSRLLTEQTRLMGGQQDQAFWRDPKAATRELRALDRVNQSLGRLDRLWDRHKEIEQAFGAADTRAVLVRIGQQLVQLEASIDRAKRELVTMGEDGRWDAIVAIKVVGAEDAMARDLMIQTYLDWGKSRRYTLDWVCVPLTVHDPAIVILRGHFAFGYLAKESGVHRIRDEERNAAARVVVVPWRDDDRAERVRHLEHRAIKGTQAFGQRVKSRLVCPNDLILQSQRTLGENQELACELSSSWDARPPETDVVVRRYQLSPMHVRDAATGWSSGRRDILAPASFNELLIRRIDQVPQPPEHE